MGTIEVSESTHTRTPAFMESLSRTSSRPGLIRASSRPDTGNAAARCALFEDKAKPAPSQKIVHTGPKSWKGVRTAATVGTYVSKPGKFNKNAAGLPAPKSIADLP